MGSATCAVTNGSPVICTNGGSSDTSSTFGITWNSSNGAYTPQQNSTNITQLFLSFNSSGNNTDQGEVSGNGYAIKVSSASTSLTLVSNSTINMTESGSLEMRSGKFLSSANNKTITVDLSGVTSENYSLIGNLLAGGARGNTNAGTFGGLGINGSVTVDGDAGINLAFTQANGGITGNVTNTGSNATNIFTFQENGTSTIGGNVTLNGGGSSGSTFANINKITGNVNLYNGTNAFTFSGNDTKIGGSITLLYGTTVFSGSDLTINGGITSGSGASGTLTFNNNVTISGAISKPNGGPNTSGATTTINFNGATNRLNGNINIAETTQNGQNIFAITFGSNATDNIISGNISSTGGNYGNGSQQHTNKIIFQGSGTNTITGSITAGRDSWGGNGKNDITFQQGGRIELTSAKQIEAAGGNNVITFQGNNDSSIVGKILGGMSGASGGRAGTNTITFGNLASTNSGATTPASTGNNSISKSEGGTDAINATGGSNTIKMYGSNASITGKIVADGSSFQNYHSTNTITLGASNSNTITGNISNSTFYSSGWSTNGTNSITFVAGATNTIAENITQSGNGTTTINFNSASGTTNAINGTLEASSGTATVNFQQGSGNAITNILSSGGTNQVNVTSSGLSIGGYIGSTGGSNTISITSGDMNITQGIYIRTAGSDRSNTITLTDGNLSIGAFSSNVTSGYGDSNGSSIHAWNGGNSNTITLSKDGAILTLGGAITSGGGSQNGNTINFNGTSGILKSSSGDSISASGITNINATSLTIQDNGLGTGTLTTTGGTTNLTFKDSTDGSLNGNITTTGGTTNLVLK
ncbi:beta strand repeat-containing protein, partial [Helicobacter brantae]